MTIASRIYKESPIFWVFFLGIIVSVLTINATSENQAYRYMLHRPWRLPLGEENPSLRDATRSLLLRSRSVP